MLSSTGVRGTIASVTADEHPTVEADVFANVRRGDFRRLQALVVQGTDCEPLVTARKRVMLAMAWLAGIKGSAKPEAHWFAEFEEAAPAVRAAALAGVSQCALVAWLCTDREGLAVCDDIAGRLAVGLGPPSQSERHCVQAWLAASALQTDVATLRKVAVEGRLAGLSHVQVIATALAARRLGDVGERETAVDVARRAARMAQADCLPQEQYLAAMTLARVRRQAGHPHLTTRILQRLRECASTPWQRWIGWEATLVDPVGAAGRRCLRCVAGPP